jgi:hypothetical protein
VNIPSCSHVVPTCDLALLSFAQYMAAAARTQAGKRMFELYAHQEMRRLEAEYLSWLPTVPERRRRREQGSRVHSMEESA